MPIAILMPALSPTMKEGHLARWHKQEGDTIVPGDVIADIETDKAVMEVEAVDEGILGRILIPAGTENVAVNATIAWLLEEGETVEIFPAESPSVSQLPQESATQAPSSPLRTPSAPQPHEQEHRIHASPLARRIARQNSVPLESLHGTGPHGRIVRADVEEALARSIAPTAQPPHPEQAPRTAQTPSATLPLDAEGLSPYTLIPHTTMRKVIARRLCESKQTVPHFYLSIECALDQLLNVRKDVNAAFPDSKVSVNDFVIRACALALQDVPEANVGWTDAGTRVFQASDIAVAVALEGGLITPIIRSAEHKGLRATSLEMKTLIERARHNKLAPEEFTGGTFSISNLGMYGIKNFQAVINPPQACILAVGAGEERAVVRSGTLSAATIMECTLSVDHRVVDGVVAARFLQAFRTLIHHPLRLVVS